jgi:DNA-binding CsgD family transcriptional regulator
MPPSELENLVDSLYCSVPSDAAQPEPAAEVSPRGAGERDGLLTVLDRMTFGIILVDEGGRVRYRNPSAGRILAQRDGLVVRNDRLMAGGRAAERLDAALAAPRGGAARGPSRAKAVFVVDPADIHSPAAPLLETMFGLTPTEVAVAVRLYEGVSIKDIARELYVGEGTVRWHMKNIVDKTGSRRQANLVRLIAGVAGWIGAA